ncbi:WD40-repeat-containing domain protein, partial [Phakopsora pachyrhizi]
RGGVRCLQFDSYKLISGGLDMMLKIFNWHTSQCIRYIEGHSEQINSVKLNSSKKKLYSCSEDNQIKIWDLNSRQTLKVLKGHAAQFGSGSHNRSLKIWDGVTGKCIHTLVGHRGGGLS